MPTRATPARCAAAGSTLGGTPKSMTRGAGAAAVRNCPSTCASSTGSPPPAASTSAPSSGGCARKRSSANASPDTLRASSSAACSVRLTMSSGILASCSTAAQRRVMGDTPSNATRPGRPPRCCSTRSAARSPREGERTPALRRRTRRAIPRASPMRRSSSGPQVRAARESSHAPRSCAAISCSPSCAESSPQASSSRCSTAASPVQARRMRAASPGCGSRPVRMRNTSSRESPAAVPSSVAYTTSTRLQVPT